jgi:glycosyltransferase involved in cell wall biosynthesis
MFLHEWAVEPDVVADKSAMVGQTAVVDIRPPEQHRVQQVNASGNARSLRIGLVAPPWVAIPPERYGGAELVIDSLARGLDQLGHEVTLFATGDATCPVDRAWRYEQAVPERMGSAAVELGHVAGAYEALEECEVIHDHTLAGLLIGEHHPGLVVTTSHGPFEPPLTDLYRRVASRVPLLAVSADHADRAPLDVPVAAAVHHGLDLERYPFAPEPTDGGYLLCLGRMHPDKGIDVAIDVARQAGLRLVIGAKMRDRAEIDYYHSAIRPRLGTGVEYVGEVDHAAKVELLGGAAALLNPIRWHEPFGLVMIEALACGTPVVATPRGAAPEIVDHGVTGYLASTPQDLRRALHGIDRIDRARCRHRALLRFSMERMATAHVEVYRALLARGSVTDRPTRPGR